MKFLTYLFPLAILLTLASAASIPSVIIVGAGMSGISAGKKLHESGIRDFMIIEATNRIGGRIHKTEFGGYTVERGANWLHGRGGPRKNPLYEMAKQIQLKSFFSDFENITSNAYKQDGGMYPKSDVDAAMKMAVDNEDYGTKISKQLRSENGKDDDMSLLALERLHKMEPSTPLERMIDFLEFDGEQAQSPRVTSLKHILPRPEFTYYGEDSFFVADSRGFESLVHVLAKSYLSYKNDSVVDSRVIFNQVVTQVIYTRKGVTLKTEDGKVYEAKTAILSPSIGVLQSKLITFTPQLPMWKRRAIHEFSLGIYTKIFLKFPTTFWPTATGTQFFLYTHERRGYYAVWQHLENEYPGANLLFVTVTDDESERIEAQPDEETKEEIMEVLRNMFGKGIPDPTHIMLPRWRSDRLYRGTFSNWPVGYTEERHRQLRAPIGGRLYFTGEHTHPELFGYADGAYFAGADTAKDVIKCLQRKIC